MKYRRYRGSGGVARWWFLAALLAVTIAVASDLGTDEHTTHSAGLVLVASVAAMVHGCLRRGSDGLALALTCAVATQPVVHLMTKWGDYDFAHGGDGLTQFAGYGPTTMMEIVAAVIVILVVNAAGRLTATQLARIAYSVLLLLGIEPGGDHRSCSAGPAGFDASMVRMGPAGRTARAARSVTCLGKRQHRFIDRLFPLQGAMAYPTFDAVRSCVCLDLLPVPNHDIDAAHPEDFHDFSGNNYSCDIGRDQRASADVELRSAARRFSALSGDRSFSWTRPRSTDASSHTDLRRPVPEWSSRARRHPAHRRWLNWEACRQPCCACRWCTAPATSGATASCLT